MSTALMIIDAQVNMFDPENAVHDSVGLLERLGVLLSRAHIADVPVVFVQNCGDIGYPDQPGSLGWQLHPKLAAQPADIIVQKHQPDAFGGTNLQRVLELAGIKNLIICGMQSELCIDATTRRAAQLGYTVTVVKDGHSTFDDSETSADQIIHYINVELAEFATIQPLSQIHFEDLF